MSTKKTPTFQSILSEIVQSPFDALFCLFIILLPWSVLISVFLGFKLSIPGVNYFKEIILVLLACSIGWEWWKNKSFPRPDILDSLTLAYIAWLVIITLANGHGLAYLVYGGRYDFEFLAALLIAKHGAPFLRGSISQYVRIFLLSASATLVFGILIRFVLHETFLLHFGYSPNLSNWSFGGTPPIYHGIEGANVRRFQGIFDGPNPAAYFIILYVGLFLHHIRTKKEYHYLASLWIIVLFGLVFLTYSRSSLVGIAVALGLVTLLSLRVIWKKHKTAALVTIIALSIVGGLFYLKYEATIDRIILREGSSKGHFDRAVTGVKRFIDYPMGQGLAEAGPAYRFIDRPTGDSLYDAENKKTEDYYIPESWYIQQLIEGGIIGTILFVAIMGYVTVALWILSVPFFAAFVAILTMNLFLHTFESVYISLLLFSFVGLFIGKRKKSHK